MAVVAGVDSSTQSTKVVLRDADTGAHVRTVSRPHQTSGTGGRSEQDPQMWLTAVRSCLDEVADYEIAALSIAAQQHGMVVTDAAGTPLRKAKLWNDTESAPDAQQLVDALGADTWARRTGSVPVASFTISKLAWLTRCEPGLRVQRIGLPHDWLTAQFTGNFSTDRGDASGTGYWSADEGWCPDLLELAGPYDVGMLPEVLDPAVIAGRWSGPNGKATVVGVGTGDNMAAALGLGVAPGDVVLSFGTSGVASTVSHTPTADATGIVAGFADATGHFLPLACTLNAMQVTDWITRLLGAPVDELAAEAPAGSGGVALLPYLAGERTPNLPAATGSFHGLTQRTEPAHLARAAVEGIVASLLDAADRLPGGNGRVILTGGGARSAAVRMVVADLSDRPVTVLDVPEAVAAGATVQAAAALHGTDPADMARQWAPTAADVLEPGGDPAGVRARHVALRGR
jgi:xylulokinase